MPIILWDASGLVKRYGREAGSDTVDAIFASPAVEQMSVTLWGYAECVAILHRKRNGKLISAASYTSSVTSLQQEVLVSSQFKVLTIEDDRILAGLPLLVRHTSTQMTRRFWRRICASSRASRRGVRRACSWRRTSGCCGRRRRKG